MAFSEEVKNRSLLACGRRCCICHAFCGTKMEVHHIKPEAEGGEDTFENAIPLCFNCHADVGHYNPKHPKGNRYSKRELIQHRKKWYERVRSGETGDKEKKEEVPPLTVKRESNQEGILLPRIKSGKELLSYIQNASVMEYDHDEPKTYQEAEIVADFVQLLYDLLDECIDMEPMDAIKYGFLLNEEIEKLEKEGYVLFANRENRIVKEGTRFSEMLPVFIVRIVRKDNPRIYKFGDKQK